LLVLYAMTSLRLLVPLLSVALFAACGGESFSDSGDDEAGSGGDSQAGTGGTGGRGGTSSTGGSSGTGTGGRAGGTSTGGTANGGGGAVAGSSGTAAGGTGGAVCCLAEATCAPDERQVSGPDDCGPGETCHEVSVCCSTIWCASGPVQCEAYPTCDPGDTQLMGACPPNYTCYDRTLCGTTITCLHQETGCNPETEYNREYLFATCETIDWGGCTIPNTKMFENECGCGCEQDPTCPAHLGCYYPQPAADRAADPAPGAAGSGMGMVLPLCDEAEVARCPYSEHY
jgi:hypothetical protein